jgi:hypothetical protein
MTAIVTIDRTDLEYGYFYGLHNTLDIEPKDRWISSPSPVEPTKPFGHCTVVGLAKRIVERFKCPVDEAHGLDVEVFAYELDVTYAPNPFTPFMSEVDHVIVNEWLADRLKRSELRGYRLLPTKTRDLPEWFKDATTTPLPNVFQLTFDGIYPVQIPRVEPASANKCPFCGAGPVVCPECGHSRNPCAECGEKWGVPAALHKGDSDRRIKIEGAGNGIAVIDARRWGGVDFMGYSHGGYVTRRALDWLLSIHAGPFLAEPIAVNVFGLSNAEREKLELARHPLPQVAPPDLDEFTRHRKRK